MRRKNERPQKGVKAEPIFYEDGKDWRIVDLRPLGVDCMPLFAFGNFAARRPGAELHVHPGHIEISFCLKGDVRYEMEGVEYPLLPGHVLMAMPDEPHRRLSNPKGMMLYRLLFRIPGEGETILGLSREESAHVARTLRQLPFRLFHATRRLRAAFTGLSAAFDAEEPDGTRRCLEMKAAALELLLALMDAPSAAHAAARRSGPKVRAAAMRIAAHPEDNLTVAALAAEAGMSAFSFTEAFKRETGFTPHAYLVDQRVRRAKDDLAKGGSNLACIAAKWRFSSPQYMATVFRRVLGVTPSLVQS